MKLVTSIALLAAVSLSGLAQARDNDRLTRGSQAWFVAESVEYVLRAQPEVSLASLSVELTGPEDLILTLGKADDATQTFNCFMFDEWSRGGTVLKKEVVCR